LVLGRADWRTEVVFCGRLQFQMYFLWDTQVFWNCLRKNGVVVWSCSPGSLPRSSCLLFQVIQAFSPPGELPGAKQAS